MRKFIIISIFSLLFNCKEQIQKTNFAFSETDAYEIVNNFIKQLNKNDLDTVVYWHERQLKSPHFKHTNIEPEEIIMIQAPQDPFPRYTSKYWNTNKIKGVRLVESKEFDYYFKKNDSIDLEKLWNLKFNNKYVHHVSYPIYNPKTNIAVIKDVLFEPFVFCGTDSRKLYYYRKTENGWKKIK